MCGPGVNLALTSLCEAHLVRCVCASTGELPLGTLPNLSHRQESNLRAPRGYTLVYPGKIVVAEFSSTCSSRGIPGPLYAHLGQQVLLCPEFLNHQYLN